MSQDVPFDRRLRRLRRERAASAADAADYLHRLAADDLIERLGAVRRSFTDALDLGCGQGYATGKLRAQGLNVVAADPAEAFARAVGGAACDEDRLPFADASLDLVFSVGVLDSVNDLPGALLLMRRALRPDGLLLAAFVGAGSLPRLRSAMLAADMAEGGGAAAHVHPQIDVRAAGDLLARAGFAMPVADSRRVDVRFPGLMELIADLRAMGATNVLAARSTRPIGRRGLAAALSDFSGHADPGGRTSETFEIVYLTGWAPSAP